MKIKILFLSLVVLSLFSCKKENDLNVNNDCFKSYFEMHNFVPYTNQIHDCQDYAILLEYENQFYFMRQNFCQRWAAIFETCEGTRIDGADSPINFSDFSINAESKGIFAIEDK